MAAQWISTYQMPLSGNLRAVGLRDVESAALRLRRERFGCPPLEAGKIPGADLVLPLNGSWGMVWQALLVALVLQLACTRGGSLKAPPLPSSFTKAEQDASDAAWAAVEHARCAEWAGHFVWNASALKFPSCLAPPKKGSEMPSRCIPNLIHQTWQTKQPPPRWQPLVGACEAMPLVGLTAAESCRRTNPSFVYLLWTDADAREYITKHHSWFLPTFDDYKFPIQRADAIRYFILRDFGGTALCLAGRATAAILTRTCRNLLGHGLRVPYTVRKDPRHLWRAHRSGGPSSE